MIIGCEREKLSNCVQMALRAVSPRATMPILSGLYISAESGRITICGTDLEMSIRAELEAEVKESGSTVVSGKLLGEIMKGLEGGEVSVETTDKYLNIKSGGGEYRIREMMPEDYPQIPSWEGGSVLKVTCGKFLQAAQQTSRASSADEKRPVLTGTLMEKNVADGTIRLVATDSYRLAWKDTEVSGSLEEWENCIVPTKTLNEVARLAGSAESDLEIKMQDKQLMFKVDDAVVSSRLIEGQFPNYAQLVPKGERTIVKLKKEELMSALKRAMVFGHNLRIGVYSESVRVATETPEVGESKEDIPAEVEGEELEIGFNGTYMIDGVAGVEEEKVMLRMDDPQKPGLLKGEEEEKYKYILMPVRLR